MPRYRIPSTKVTFTFNILTAQTIKTFASGKQAETKPHYESIVIERNIPTMHYQYYSSHIALQTKLNNETMHQFPLVTKKVQDLPESGISVIDQERNVNKEELITYLNGRLNSEIAELFYTVQLIMDGDEIGPQPNIRLPSNR